MNLTKIFGVVAALFLATLFFTIRWTSKHIAFSDNFFVVQTMQATFVRAYQKISDSFVDIPDSSTNTEELVLNIGGVETTFSKREVDLNDINNFVAGERVILSYRDTYTIVFKDGIEFCRYRSARDSVNIRK